MTSRERGVSGPIIRNFEGLRYLPDASSMTIDDSVKPWRLRQDITVPGPYRSEHVLVLGASFTKQHADGTAAPVQLVLDRDGIPQIDLVTRDNLTVTLEANPAVDRNPGTMGFLSANPRKEPGKALYYTVLTNLRAGSGLIPLTRKRDGGVIQQVLPDWKPARPGRYVEEVTIKAPPQCDLIVTAALVEAPHSTRRNAGLPALAHARVREVYGQSRVAINTRMLLA